jgi:hypothetical protein
MFGMITRRGFLQKIIGGIGATLTAPLLKLLPAHRCEVLVSNEWTEDGKWHPVYCGRPARFSLTTKWGNRVLGENFDRYSTHWRCDDHARSAGMFVRVAQLDRALAS